MIVWLLTHDQGARPPGVYASARAAMICLDREIQAGTWDWLWAWPSHWKRKKPEPSPEIAGRRLCRWIPSDPANPDGEWVLKVPYWSEFHGFRLCPVEPVTEPTIDGKGVA